jgi:branched-chain amino acid transport system permease protein
LFKLSAFVISAFFAGMIGAVWGYSLSSVFPQSAFDPLNDITLALMAFMGGLGTLAGPILGALIVEWAKLNFDSVLVRAQQNLPFLRHSAEGSGGDTSGYYLIIYGALFLVVIFLLPEGIVPTLRKWWLSWLARRSRVHAPDTTEAANQALPVAVEQAEQREG